MCIIIAKKRGVEYNKKELEEAIKVAKIHNSHGAGFAYKRGDSEEIYLSKGYLYYYDLMLDKLDALNIQQEDELIVHLRFATSGLVDDSNCHPFIVSSDLEEVLETETVTNKLVMAHNGTFYDYSYKDDDNSDTVNFILEFASIPNAINSLKVLKNIDKNLPYKILDGNRLCFMHPGKERMVLFGDWNKLNKEDAGFVYSNYYHMFPDSHRAYGGKSPHNKKAY
jgi:predicted glutamine amidotransferase